MKSRRSDAKRRVTILGTSNSIIKGGGTAAIREHPGIELVANLSLSFSDCTVFAFRRPRLDVLEQDFVVHELAIGDQVAAWRGKDNSLLTAGLLDQFFSWCRGSAVRPVVCVYPYLDELRGSASDEVREVRATYEEMCRRRGVAFVDGNDVIRTMIAEDPQLSFEDCFSDAWHLRPEYGAEVGARVADLIVGDRLTLPLEAERTCSYEYFAISDRRRGSRERRTSFAAEAFCEIEDGMSAVWLDERVVGSRIVGMVHNLAQSNASLLVESGSASSVVRLGTRFYDPSRELWLCSSALDVPLIVNGPVELSIDVEERGRSDVRAGGRPGLPHAQNRVEVAGVVVAIGGGE